jgi:hypothetical protein
MKRPIRASLSFKNQKPAEKFAFGTNVITGLTAAGTEFPNLPVTLALLTTTNTDVAHAITAAADGGRTAKAALKTKVGVWNDAFAKTANYVSLVANGDVNKINDSGFLPTKGETSPAQKPGKANDFKATINGSKGTIIASTKKSLTGAKALVFTAAPDGMDISYAGNTVQITVGDKTMYIIVDTERQTEFVNLPSGTMFNVNVYGVNSAGSGPATTAQQVVTQ